MEYMARMEISTNIACRVQCDFCPQELLIEEYSARNNLKNISYGQPIQMSFDTFKKCLSTIPKSILIGFTGYTEPFLNPECSKMVLHAYENGYPIEVFSTLVGMKLEDVELIKRVRFKTFHIHLPDEKNVAKIAVNNDYINILKKVLNDITNVTAMSMANLHPKIKNFLDKDLTPDEMMNRAGNVKSLKPTPKKLGPLVCGRHSKQDLLDIVDENVLLPNGDVALCGMDYGLQHIIGNLLEQNYDSIFKTEKYMEFRKKQKSHDGNVLCRFCPEAISQSTLTEKQNLKSFIGTNLDSSLAKPLFKLYEDNLERFPDKEGFDYFYDKLANNQLSLLDIKHLIEQSSEYKSIHPIKLN
jgi:radical SAM protein with 4Fe4S-binding SPASM domain